MNVPTFPHPPQPFPPQFPPPDTVPLIVMVLPIHSGHDTVNLLIPTPTAIVVDRFPKASITPPASTLLKESVMVYVLPGVPVPTSVTVLFATVPLAGQVIIGIVPTAGTPLVIIILLPVPAWFCTVNTFVPVCTGTASDHDHEAFTTPVATAIVPLNIQNVVFGVPVPTNPTLVIPVTTVPLTDQVITGSCKITGPAGS